MGHGVIVSGLQIVEAGFGVVVIAAIAQGGASRPPPVAESREAREWQRSKKSRIGVSPMIFSGTATGERDSPSSNSAFCRLLVCHNIIM